MCIGNVMTYNFSIMGCNGPFLHYKQLVQNIRTVMRITFTLFDDILEVNEQHFSYNT